MRPKKKSPTRRPFVGVLFKCCKVYSRVHLNASGKAFVGWCPKCAGKTEIKVSPTGTKSRFFRAE